MIDIGDDDLPEITRRNLKDARVWDRVESEVQSVARYVQRRRVAEWAASDAGPYPEFGDSTAIATREVAILIESLGPLVLFDLEAEAYGQAELSARRTKRPRRGR